MNEVFWCVFDVKFTAERLEELCDASIEKCGREIVKKKQKDE